MKNPSYHNPYADIPETEMCRLTTDISKADWEFLKLIRPYSGTFNISTNILIKSLINELKRSNITDITDMHDFEYCIANLRVVLPDRNGLHDRATDLTRPQPGTCANGPDDLGAAKGVCGETPQHSNLPSNLQSGGTKGKVRPAKRKAGKSVK